MCEDDLRTNLGCKTRLLKKRNSHGEKIKPFQYNNSLDVHLPKKIVIPETADQVTITVGILRLLCTSWMTKC